MTFWLLFEAELNPRSGNLRGHEGISPFPHYLLTFLASLIEIGVPMYFLYRNVPLVFITLFASLYHFGYLTKEKVKVSSSTLHVSATLLVAFLFLLTLSMATENICLLGFSLLVSTTLIQMIRSLYKKTARIDTTSKNIVRIFGFAVAGICVFHYYVIGIIGLVFGLLVVFFPSENGKTKEPVAAVLVVQSGRESGRSHELKSLLFFEFLHHAHYFMYCYFVIALLYSVFGVPWELLGILFLVGWLGYSVDAAIIKSFEVSYPMLGHLLSAACIALIAFSENLGQVLGLWFLTGIGGGTAYVLDFATSLKIHRDKREIYENLGHVTGPLLASLVIVLLDLGSVFVIAGLVCFTAAIVIVFSKITERAHDE